MEQNIRVFSFRFQIKRSMIIFLFIVGLIIVIFVTGKLMLANQFSKEVKQLFAQSKDISHKTFDYEMLLNLPEPVQRYFKHVLKNGQPYIHYVRLKHTGQFKTSPNKDWTRIEGEQYFTTDTPGFIWKGTTSMFTARDMYIGGAGRLVVSLFSIFNVVDGKGEKFNQGQILRWLGESVWFPTNFLPGKNLKWTAIDNASAKLIFEYAGLAVSYIVSFNDIGEITQLETKRYMGNKGLETWIGKLSDYKEMNSVVIPTNIEGIWRLPEGDYSYAKFIIKTIEYNKREKF